MTLILSRTDVLELLPLPDRIDAVERAFRLRAEGRTLGPGVLSVHTSGGGFHIKAAGLVGERSYFAAKTNGNFSDNPRRWGLPTIQGTIVLADAANGTPLAIMDSGSVTALRTGAATAVAAKFLARPDAHTATIVGCGVQGEVQLAAIAAVLPLRRIYGGRHRSRACGGPRGAGIGQAWPSGGAHQGSSNRPSRQRRLCDVYDLTPSFSRGERYRAGDLHRRGWSG